jgi:hypothetical protein
MPPPKNTSQTQPLGTRWQTIDGTAVGKRWRLPYNGSSGTAKKFRGYNRTARQEPRKGFGVNLALPTKPDGALQDSGSRYTAPFSTTSDSRSNDLP